MTRPHPTPSERKKLGRYELLFRIASGGMADVYAALTHGEEGFSKLVAVKRMREQMSDDEDFVTMFIDEGKIASNIHSPHVVTTHDLGRADDGSLFIAMELVVGTSLWEIFRKLYRDRAGFPISAAIEVIIQTALGLHAAHEARTPLGEPLNVIHRDISPQNILIDRHGGVRLTDFGIAHAMQRATHTVGQEIKGKYAYCSPEQIDCRQLDRRSDLFSLGTVAWELLAGKQLFATKHPLQTMKRVLEEEIPDVRESRPEVPEGVAQVIANCLKRPPDLRPSSAAEIAEQLRRACADANVPLGAQALGRFVSEHAPQKMSDLESRLRAALDDEVTIEQFPARDSLGIPASGVSRREVMTADEDVSGLQEAGSSPNPARAAAISLSARGLVVLALVIGATVGVGIALSGDAPSAEPTDPHISTQAPLTQPSTPNAPAPLPVPTPALDEPQNSPHIEVAPSPRPTKAGRPNVRRNPRATPSSMHAQPAMMLRGSDQDMRRHRLVDLPDQFER